MSRTSKSPSSRRRRRKILRKAKGARGGRSKLFKTALETVRKGLLYSYRDRRQKKREFRKLWIVRISAACKARGLSYSKFINGLKKSHINLNRKMLSDIAVNDTKAFNKITDIIKESLKNSNS